MLKDNYSLLIEKLDAFIRKFYINQLLRGALYTVGAVLGLFILLNVAEYYFYFSTGVRTAMFWSFMALSGTALWRWVALPLMHYFHLGKVISHEQAAQIIGQHFADVKDKLLNILQLKQQSNNAIYAELINASINQKSEQIKLVPFTSAIDLGKNRKYLRYALPPVLLFFFLILGAPNIIREGTMRLWNSTTKFEKPAPFKFLINADSLKAVQFSDFLLKVKVEGSALPNEVFISLGNLQYRLTKDAANEFSYKFANVQKDTEFKLFSGAIESRDYTLKVLKKPNILSFNTKLTFPPYIGRASEELSNVGDLVVPQGTNIGWVFNAQHTDNLALRFGNDPAAEAKRFDDELFQFNRRAMKDETYKVFLSNALLSGADSVAYTITVIPDLHPQISVEEFKDSANLKLAFFAGDASDDYGLSNLTFNYQIKKARGGQMPMNTVKIEKPAGKQVEYEYTWDIRNLNLEPGDEVTYYFEVFDNDGVNGPKSARTGLMQYRMPTLEEFRQQQADNSQEIKKDLEKAMKESLKIQEELKKLRDKVLQKKELDWQTRKEMEKLMGRQKELQKQIEQAKQNFDQNKEQQQEFNQQNEEQQQKQEQLEKMFEETMSEEMKQLIEDIQKLLQEMNKEDMLEKMEDMQMNSEDLSKDLERLQELYKQLEVENLLQQQIEQLEELAKEQEELAKDTEESNKSDEQLEQEQQKLNEKMDDLQKKMDDLLKKNEELKRPENIEDNKEEMKDAQKDMQDAKKDINQKQKKSASKKQKSAANKLKEMANKMKQNSQAGEMEQMEEDMKTLRQLLENLVGLSFNQEQTMKDVSQTTVNTPRYVELAQQQFKIKDDFKLVEDSLQALASRNFQMESIITDKVTEIKAAIKNSLEELEERRVNSATEHQQRSMKGLNDLALMLSEVMEQMQQQMSMTMPGSQACQKPGGSKGQGEPKDKISKGQEDLNKIMKDLKERLEKQGKGQPGQQGQPGMSEEFAKMAAKQAALRNALRELQKKKMEQGKGDKGLEDLMEEMNKTEIDLVNKRLNNETMRRQQDILTRLLEHEKAEREREQDEQRQAQTAKQQPAKMPPALEEYLKKRRAEIEQFRTVSPALKPYYKQLVEEYLKGAK
ncbi:MAG: ATPase [Saprospiraceae bacterium]